VAGVNGYARTAMNDKSNGHWLTYSEASKRLGISIEAIRHRVRRNALTGTRGNDGRPRVWVAVQLAGLAVHEQAVQNGQTDALAKIRTADERLVDHLEHRITEQGAKVARLEQQIADAREHADRRVADAVADVRAEAARRLADVQTMHLGHIERLLAQAGIERSLWLERVDAAEVRAERVEQRLDQVLDQLLADRRQLVANHVEQGDRLPWWRRWFGRFTKSDLGRG